MMLKVYRPRSFLRSFVFVTRYLKHKTDLTRGPLGPARAPAMGPTSNRDSRLLVRHKTSFGSSLINVSGYFAVSYLYAHISI